MMISSRGRYVLRVLADLAQHSGGEYIPMKDIAERQEISLKYIEKIMPVLTKSGMVDGLHGKGGGYRLNRPPEEYKVGDILRLTEGTLALPVADGNAANQRRHQGSDRPQDGKGQSHHRIGGRDAVHACLGCGDEKRRRCRT